MKQAGRQIRDPGLKPHLCNLKKDTASTILTKLFSICSFHSFGKLVGMNMGSSHTVTP